MAFGPEVGSLSRGGPEKGTTMTDLVSRARAFALKAHQGQTRKGAAQEPYVLHLQEAADFVARHGGDDIAIA